MLSRELILTESKISYRKKRVCLSLPRNKLALQDVAYIKHYLNWREISTIDKYFQPKSITYRISMIVPYELFERKNRQGMFVSLFSSRLKRSSTTIWGRVMPKIWLVMSMVIRASSCIIKERFRKLAFCYNDCFVSVTSCGSQADSVCVTRTHASWS